MKHALVIVSLFAIAFAGCGGNVVVDNGGTAGGSTGGPTFACGDQTCQRDTELCVHIPPIQPPPEGDGMDVYECVALPPTCPVPPSCTCAGAPTSCSSGVASCSVSTDGALTIDCYPSL